METFSDRTGVKGGVESKIGGRSENQDSYGMSETRLGMLVVVCDGMGGGPAGKTASTIATQAILDYVSGSPLDKNPMSVLEDAGVAANEAVLAAVAENPALKGMGTTCVCVLIRDKEAYIMHVGDSRCYQLRGGAAVFRTADHSYVGELVRRGTMSEEDARTSRYSNVITRAIGAGTEVIPEVDHVDYKPGDRFALMSDGIWGSMPEPQLVVLLCSDEDPAELVVDVAERVDAIGVNKGGGHDNLTLAVVDIPGSKEKSVTTTVNDKFKKSAGASVAPKATASAQAAPAKNLTVKPGSQKRPEPKKAQTEEEIEKAPRSGGHGVTTWLLVTLLIAAIGVISWLLYTRGAEDDVVADNNPANTGIIDNRTSVKSDTGQTGVTSDNNSTKDNTSQPQVNGGQTQAQTEGARRIQEVNDAAKSRENETQTQGQPEEKHVDGNVKEMNRAIDLAIKKLEELRDYNKKEKSKDDKKLIRGREALYNDIYSAVTVAETNAPSNMKEDFKKLKENIDKNKRQLSRSMFENQSSQECLTAVAACTKQLESLKK